MQEQALLATEGVVLLDDGLVGSIIYRDYHAPGTYSSFRKVAVSGAIVITGERLVVWLSRARAIDVTLRDPRRSAIAIRPTGEPPDGITFRYDAAAFKADRSGTVEIHFRTAAALAILHLLNSM